MHKAFRSFHKFDHHQVYHFHLKTEKGNNIKHNKTKVKSIDSKLSHKLKRER